MNCDITKLWTCGQLNISWWDLAERADTVHFYLLLFTVSYWQPVVIMSLCLPVLPELQTNTRLQERETWHSLLFRRYPPPLLFLTCCSQQHAHLCISHLPAWQHPNSNHLVRPPTFQRGACQSALCHLTLEYQSVHLSVRRVQSLSTWNIRRQSVQETDCHTADSSVKHAGTQRLPAMHSANTFSSNIQWL